MERYVICIAGDGCVSVSGHGHSHHCCEEEQAPACACEHHETIENDAENLVASDCTDIEIHFSVMVKAVNDGFSIPQWYAETPRFEVPKVTDVYKAPIWCRHLVYPPQFLTCLRSTVILC